MKKILPLFLLSCILISCNKDESMNSRLTAFKIYSNDGSLISEYHFKYDAENRLIEKQTPLTKESIFYSGQRVSKWITEYSFSSSTSKKEENYFYTQQLLDSIKFIYVNGLENIEMEKYFHEGGKYIRKNVFAINVKIYEYTYSYDSEGKIREVIKVNPILPESFTYTYNYDSEGNLINVHLNNLLLSEFEYLSTDNPLHITSRPHILNIPIEINSSETELITSNKLISKAKYYTSSGTIDNEIVNEYTMDKNGLPISCLSKFNERVRIIEFEYK